MDLECPNCREPMVLCMDEEVDLVDAMDGRGGTIECPECGYTETADSRGVDE